MSIMAAQDLNDARGAARLMAMAARRSIEEQGASTAASRVALGGLFRLLRAYRAHRLAGFAYQPHREGSQEGMAIVAPGESHITAVRDALQRALAEVYENDEEIGLESVEAVLRAVASENRLEPNDVRRTSCFLESLVEKLEAAA
ncbi:MAG TPA: hypothetical protein VF535_04840 [Allosphingosinicella sp.]|jgi:vacuolar-type H+-ATPase subunit I/STV1